MRNSFNLVVPVSPEKHSEICGYVHKLLSVKVMKSCDIGGRLICELDLRVFELRVARLQVASCESAS